MKDKEIDFNRELLWLGSNETFPIAMKGKKEIEEATVVEMEGEREVKRIDENKLPRETVGSALITCALRYVADDPADGFYIRMLVDLIKDAQTSQRKVFIKEKLRNFLAKLIKESTRLKKGDRETGVYQSWVTSQIAEEVGIELEETEEEEK